MVNKKLIFGIIVPLLVILAIAIFSSISHVDIKSGDFFESSTVETVDDVRFDDIFASYNNPSRLVDLQNWTINNDDPIRKTFEVPYFVACLINHGDYNKPIRSLDIWYSDVEGPWMGDEDDVLYGDEREDNYRIDIPPSGMKRFKLSFESIYLQSYDEIKDMKGYDELRIVEVDRYYTVNVNPCRWFVVEERFNEGIKIQVVE